MAHDAAEDHHLRMAVDLPGWAKRREAIDADEARRLRDMTPVQRLELLRALCRDAARLLRAMPDDRRKRALEFRDPVPESTRAALARLRAAHRAQGSGQ